MVGAHLCHSFSFVDHSKGHKLVMVKWNADNETQVSTVPSSRLGSSRHLIIIIQLEDDQDVQQGVILSLVIHAEEDSVFFLSQKLTVAGRNFE